MTFQIVPMHPQQTAACLLCLHAYGALSQVGRLVYWHWVKFRGKSFSWEGTSASVTLPLQITDMRSSNKSSVAQPKPEQPKHTRYLFKKISIPEKEAVFSCGGTCGAFGFRRFPVSMKNKRRPSNAVIQEWLNWYWTKRPPWFFF